MIFDAFLRSPFSLIFWLHFGVVFGPKSGPKGWPQIGFYAVAILAQVVELLHEVLVCSLDLYILLFVVCHG